MSRQSSVYLAVLACISVMGGIAGAAIRHLDNEYYFITMLISLSIWLNVTVNVFKLRKEDNGDYDTRGTISSKERN